jgi:CTP:molybdopterin cytidylyltransferase MocA
VIVGILLAAGQGRRIGVPKALLRLEGETFHTRTLAAFRAAGLETIVVVNRAVDEAIGVAHAGEHRVLNPDPDHPSGMFESVRLGAAAAIERGASGALYLPVDLPLVTTADILAVGAMLGGGASIVVATHGERRGHPIGVSRSVLEEILASPASITLRDIVRSDAGRVVEVPASEGAILGVNTPEDLERVSNRTFR